MSTVTIDDKENRDPVTGLPLSSLLAPNAKGNKKGTVGANASQKYIATTITTTVLSPVPTMPVEPSSLSKVQKGGSARVALGVVKKANVTSATSLLPITSTFSSLADADTDEEETAPKKARAPRRSLRIAAANSPTRLSSAISSSATNVRPTASSKTMKRQRTSKRSASALSSTPANVAPSSPTSKAKKLALAKHTAAVVAAAVDAQEDVHAQVLSERLEDGGVDATPSASLVRISPPQKKRRTSGRNLSSTPTSASALQTLSGGVRAFEVSLPPSAVDPAMDVTLEGDQMDMDTYMEMGLETASPDDATATIAAVQRIINQQCKELTVLPLANVSDAYITPSRSVSVSNESTMPARAKRL